MSRVGPWYRFFQPQKTKMAGKHLAPPGSTTSPTGSPKRTGSKNVPVAKRVPSKQPAAKRPASKRPVNSTNNTGSPGPSRQLVKNQTTHNDSTFVNPPDSPQGGKKNIDIESPKSPDAKLSETGASNSNENKNSASQPTTDPESKQGTGVTADSADSRKVSGEAESTNKNDGEISKSKTDDVVGENNEDALSHHSFNTEDEALLEEIMKKKELQTYLYL